LIITTLIENTTLSREYKKKHGLCLHIKTKEHSILFDLGPDDTFIENAIKLNISISNVDIVVISHGHKDHGGGLEEFLNHNTKAKIYINENAFDSYYTSIMKYGKYYVGLNNNLRHNNRIILTKDNYSIDSDMYLLSDVKANNLIPRSNESLLKKEGTKYIKDNFIHEQNLILKEEDKYILIAGCSHRGITNIIEKAEKVIGKNLDIVIGGFHLFNPVSKKSESYDFIKSIGANLSTRDTTFYTLHCTGIKSFEILSQTLKNQIRYLSTGQVIEI
jgi:7,8-dihydropterin-6-yl-methyl-4-(beta-D-ribofuranosyl)aminobenzene 5'-phosphate synthase